MSSAGSPIAQHRAGDVAAPADAASIGTLAADMALLDTGMGIFPVEGAGVILLRGGQAAEFLSGITTNHCCETTARVAGDLGYDVLFALDATHTFDRTGPYGYVVTADELARTTATNLDGEFATVVSTRHVIDLLQASEVGVGPGSRDFRHLTGYPPGVR